MVDMVVGVRGMTRILLRIHRHQKIVHGGDVVVAAHDDEKVCMWVHVRSRVPASKYAACVRVCARGRMCPIVCDI